MAIIMMHKNYGAPKLCTKINISNPSSHIFHNKFQRTSIQESVYNWTESNDTRKKIMRHFFQQNFYLFHTKLA